MQKVLAIKRENEIVHIFSLALAFYMDDVTTITVRVFIDTHQRRFVLSIRACISQLQK